MFRWKLLRINFVNNIDRYVNHLLCGQIPAARYPGYHCKRIGVTYDLFCHSPTKAKLETITFLGNEIVNCIMGIILSWLTPGCCLKVDEKKKISRQIDKEILQELKQEAGWIWIFTLFDNCQVLFPSPVPPNQISKKSQIQKSWGWG